MYTPAKWIDCKIEQLCSALLNPPNMYAPEKKLIPPR